MRICIFMKNILTNIVTSMLTGIIRINMPLILGKADLTHMTIHIVEQSISITICPIFIIAMSMSLRHIIDS